MSIGRPVRLRISKAGVVQGYVEALEFDAGVTVSGPVASITSGGGGGGDADTLQGHPASFFATASDLNALSADVVLLETDVAALMDRALKWSLLGVAVQNAAPATGITFAQWLAGVSGYWMWVKIP